MLDQLAHVVGSLSKLERGLIAVVAVVWFGFNAIFAAWTEAPGRLRSPETKRHRLLVIMVWILITVISLLGLLASIAYGVGATMWYWRHQGTSRPLAGAVTLIAFMIASLLVPYWLIRRDQHE